jgi:D-alanyl-lipoteichoic acid acyltransferase DltB (MBOAT superfamily)
VDFFVGRYLGRERAPGRRRLALVLSLIFNLGMIGFFKYFEFFEDSLVVLGSLVWWHFDPFTLDVILPIGISFYTFMTITTSSTCTQRIGRRRICGPALFVAYFHTWCRASCVRRCSCRRSSTRGRSRASRS